ncbi:MAG: Npun_F0494 family protein [Leptolyngbyaceae cyanobacterium]
MGFSSIRSIQYPPNAVRRASRAVRCSPFTVELFEAMRYHSVQLGAIAGPSGVQQGYVRRPVTERVADDQTLWLIQIGLLRREVDGQGLTDSFRLTPLGRQLVHLWQHQGERNQPASVLDYLLNWIAQWLRWPNWL